METLNDYLRRLHTALEKKRPYVTYNRDKAHASLVVSAGFRHAEDKVNILSHELDPDVYESPALLKSVEYFLDRAPEARLNILVEKEEAVRKDHQVFQIGEQYKEQVTIKKVPSHLQKRYDCNFMLIDSFGYRFEPDRNKPNAMVAFHDDDHRHMIETLERFFGILESQGEEVTVSSR